MRRLESLALRTDGEQVLVLDQTRLPHEEIWIRPTTVEQMVNLIKDLRVRGAPLIGVAASLSLAQLVERGASEGEFFAAAAALREARPTAVNLMKCMDRLTDLARTRGIPAIPEEAERIFQEDKELCEQIADHGQNIFEEGDHVLTHCNTGGLATAGGGTALGVIARAHRAGRKLHVFVDETRPLLQGARLTAWECAKLDIPFTLICDNMAASLMQSGRVQKVIVGADRIAANGDFANKVGTYGLAVLAAHHRIPFYVAAPDTTVDPETESGQAIEIEQRDPKEVRSTLAPVCEVWNPAFDVTPAYLVSGWILNRGLFTRTDIENGLLRSRGVAAQVR